MRSITRPGRVPLGRRQLGAEPAKLVVSLLAVGAAVALVLLLSGLRRGMGEQVTLYVDHQAPVLAGQAGSRNFLSQTSVLAEELGSTISRVPGVARADPISQQYAMLQLHGRRILALLVGYDPGRPGGPWEMDSGREPSASGELVLDRVLASEHGLEVDSTLEYRGARLHIVGLSRGTSGFMTPLAFATRGTVNGLNGQAGTASFFLVRPDPGVSPGTLADRIESAVAGVSAMTRSEVAANDRRQFVDSFSGPLLAMVAIAFAVAIIVIGLTIYSSTSERRREYATLKALGLRNRALLSLVGVQSAGLALTGTALGTLLALAAVQGVSALAPKYLIVVTPAGVGLMAVGALAIAVAAGLLPARFLASLDPASAFRR